MLTAGQLHAFIKQCKNGTLSLGMHFLPFYHADVIFLLCCKEQKQNIGGGALLREDHCNSFFWTWKNKYSIIKFNYNLQRCFRWLFLSSISARFFLYTWRKEIMIPMFRNVPSSSGLTLSRPNTGFWIMHIKRPASVLLRIMDSQSLDKLEKHSWTSPWWPSPKNQSNLSLMEPAMKAQPK